MTRLSRTTTLALAGALAATALGAGAGDALAAPPPLYVSASATSDPSCATASPANPFATLAGALACSVNGTTITIGPGTFAGQVTLAHNVTLQGAGASTVIDGPTSTADVGSPAITIPDGRSETIRNLTIDGVTQSTPGIVAGSGKLKVSGTTIVNNGNHMGTAGGGISVRPESGVASVTITSTTISANTSDSGGSGLFVDSANATPSTVTLLDSTIAGNEGSGGLAWGGGILLRAASLTARDSTIAANTASTGGGLFKELYPGSVSLTNTIVAGNTADVSPDCSINGNAPTSVDGGHDVIGTECRGFTDGVNGDQVGTAASPLDPMLGALASNGGPTKTMAPLLGSPALNTGDWNDCASAAGGNDQRGVSRNAAGRLVCDVGAYDTGAVPVQTLHVSASAGADPACAAASPARPFRTVAGALACAGNGATVKIGAGTFPGQVTLDHNVVLAGAGASTVLTGATSTANLSNIAADVTLAPGRFAVLKSLKLDGVDQTAPGVALANGSLTVIGSTITRAGNHVVGGAGIDARPTSGAALVTVYDSTIDHNTSDRAGGGIAVMPRAGVPSTLTVLNSTIADNAVNGSDNGGGIALGFASATLRDSTVSGNSTSYAGAGLWADADLGSISLTNTIIAGNSAPSSPDCVASRGRTAIDGGHNLIGQNTGAVGTGCSGFADGVNGDRVGSAAAPLDPMLAALASNGGAAQTMALLAGSPALGAGGTADCKATPIAGKDERGRSRSVAARGACDIGAYDAGGSAG